MPSISSCRSCGSEDVSLTMSLGNIALSDFKPRDEKFETAPLDLYLCRECSLVQLGNTVDREKLYRHYYYRSGLQESMVAALRDVVDDAASRVELSPGDAWLDIGANDGTLLSMVGPNVVRFAYEPAINLWKDLQPHVEWLGRWWPDQSSTRPAAAGFKFKVITSIACFYDADDPNAWAESIKEHLHPDGVWINQMSYLPQTLASNNFGDICHEHLTYWSGYALQHLLARHGLRIVQTTFNDVNGGSFRTIIKHGQDIAWAQDKPTLMIMKRFKQRVDIGRTDVRSFLHACARDGQSVIGYGASTKGNTYLQYWGVGPDLLGSIADRNPDKVGLFTPTGQKVISEEDMRSQKPDYLLVLPWHFLDAFVVREAGLLDRGTIFAVPFPELRFVGKSNAHAFSQAATSALGVAASS